MMKKINILIVAIFSITIGFAQQYSPTYFKYPQAITDPTCILVGSSINNGAIVGSNMPTGKIYPTTHLQEKTIEAKLKFRLDLGTDYVVSSANAATVFEVKVTVAFNLNGVQTSKELVINDRAPEQLLAVDFLTDVNSSSLLSTTSVTIADVDISTGGNSPQPLVSGSFISNYINNSLRISASIERTYAIDVRDYASQLLVEAIHPTNLTITGKRAHFEWGYNGGNEGYRFPNYEIQILRLYDMANSDENSFSTIVDWSDALKVETQSYKTSIDLTIMEGTGFYLWRVRPIGTYYEGGIANSENYGAWSTDIETGDLLSSNTSAVYGWNDGQTPSQLADLKLFYYEDQEADLNWIYSRVFTEGDGDEDGVRTSEGMSYADPLLRVRQSQAFNNEDKTTIVSQSIPDFSGRNAISILPVPIETQDGLSGYKTSFVKNNQGDLYTAFDYDQDLNVDNPSIIQDQGTDFSYYNGSNTDGVADAEGYTFSRTKFKTDGSSRVSEESGIGAAFALGTQHTSRVIYSSPSDEELLRVFGAEAPLAESVIKTISIDPNGLISVDYTSKEGQTIATALISNSTDNLLPLSNPGVPFTVKNSTGQSIIEDHKFRSTKRIALWEDKMVTINYNVTAGGNGCTNCNLAVRFHLIDLTTNDHFMSDADGTTTLIDEFPFEGSNFLPSGDLKFTNFPNWKWVKVSNIAVSSYTISGVAKNQFLLPKGEYLMIKEVMTLNPVDIISTTVGNESAIIETILDVIQAKMVAVTNSSEQADFESLMVNLADKLDDTPRNNQGILDLLGITESIQIPESFVLGYTQNSGTTPSQISISTGSCATCPSTTISVPKPDVCMICDANPANDPILRGIEHIRGNTSDLSIGSAAWNTINQIVMNGLNPNEPDGFIDYLLANEAVVGGQALFRDFAPGFTAESMGYMITNMLVSKYYTGNKIINSGIAYAADENTDGILEYLKSDGTLSANFTDAIEVSGLTNIPFNYSSCKDLYKCWVQAVDMIGTTKFEGSTNIMDEYNDRTDGASSEDEYDNEDNQEDAEDNGAFQGLMDFIISVKMRKFNDSDEGTVSAPQMNSLVSLPALFFQCAGYQFAEIIDEDIVSSGIPADYTNALINLNLNSLAVTNHIVLSGELTTMGTKSPILMEEDQVTHAQISCTTCSPEMQLDQLYYSYIFKPEWMFKYFVYNSNDGYNSTSASNISDNNSVLINQKEIELSTCYNDPFVNCNLNLPKCNKYCNYYHQSWSADQRLNFYQLIKGGNKCPRALCPIEDEPAENEPLEEYDPATLKQMVDDKIAAAKSSCDDRKEEFKSLITSELLNSCYTIVDCVTASSPVNEVSQANIDEMVISVTEACKQKVNQINLTNTSVYWYSGSQVNNDNQQLDNGEYPYCEIIGCKGIDISTGICTQSAYRELVLFQPCDQQILDQVNFWSFDLNIPVPSNISNCPSKKIKEWPTAIGGECSNTQMTPSGATVSTATTIGQ